MATGDLTIKYGANGKLIEASGSSFFANSQNDKKINFIFNEDLGDSAVFASFKLPIAVQTNLYGNYKAQSLLLSKKVDDDGGYYYTAYLPAEYIEISTLLNNKMYVNAVVQTTNGVEQFKGKDGDITINNVACTWAYGDDNEIVITYKGVEYTESNNAITIDNKVYLIKDKTLSGTFTLEAGLIVKTYQPVEIKVLDSQGTYNAIPVMQGQYDVLSKRIAEIDSALAGKQDKKDSKINVIGDVVGALNWLYSTAKSHQQHIQNDELKIDANSKNIEWLKGKVQGIVSVGVLETNENTATNDELDAFVLEKMGREPQVNDAVVNNVIKENDTDESYFFIYNESSDWQGFQIQFIESASNNAKGILKGSGDEATSESPIKVSIANGEIVDVQVFGESSKSLSTWIQILNDIFTGAVAVPKATADKNGNDIVDTYLSKNDGATKQYVQNYSAPKCLYDIFYCNFANQSLVENNTSDDSYKTIVSSSEIGETQIATLDLALLHDVQIGKQNGIGLQLYLTDVFSEKVDLIVRTYYKTTTATDLVLLGSVKSSNVKLSSSLNAFKINNYFTELSEPITLNTGDIIEQRVFVNRSQSGTNKFTLVCNTTYPSLAEITKQGIVNYYLEKSPYAMYLGSKDMTIEKWDDNTIAFYGYGSIDYRGGNEQDVWSKVVLKVDSEAKENSNALLTSGTIYNALKETGKINSISLNNEALAIDENKNVNIDITAYATKQYVDENGGKVDDIQLGGESILDTTTKIANIESQEPEQMGIDETAIKDSTNLITSGAVYNAMGLEMELIYSTENGVNLATLIDTAEAVIGNFKALAVQVSTSVGNQINSPIVILPIPTAKTSDVSSYGYTGTKNVQLRCSNPTSSGLTEWVFDVNYGELSTTNTLNMYIALKGQLTYTENGVSYSASTSGQSGIERLYIYGIR